MWFRKFSLKPQLSAAVSWKNNMLFVIQQHLVVFQYFELWGKQPRYLWSMIIQLTYKAPNLQKNALFNQILKLTFNIQTSPASNSWKREDGV